MATVTSPAVLHASSALNKFLGTCKLVVSKHCQASVALSTPAIRSHDREPSSLTIVLGNESADLDSVASSVVYAHWLSSNNFKSDGDTASCLHVPVIGTKREDFPLRSDIVWMLKNINVDWNSLIFLDDVDLAALIKQDKNLQVILVDHNSLSGHRALIPPEQHLLIEEKVSTIIDHHVDTNHCPNTTHRVVETVGSCSSLIAREIGADAFQKQTMELSCAQLLFSTIAVDTIGLNPALKRTFPTDITAACMLVKVLHGEDIFEDPATTSPDSTSREGCHVSPTAPRTNNATGSAPDKVRALAEATCTALTKAKEDISALTVTQLLSKDYKERHIVVDASASHGSGISVNVGVASVPAPLVALLRTGDEALADVDAYMHIRSLHVLYVMTAFSSDGFFHREIAVFERRAGGVLDASKQTGTSTPPDMLADPHGLLPVTTDGSTAVVAEAVHVLDGANLGLTPVNLGAISALADLDTSHVAAFSQAELGKSRKVVWTCVSC